MAVRVDYFQMGLNDKRCLNYFKHIKHQFEGSIQVIAGDHSGYVLSSMIRMGRDVDDVFKSAPDACFQVTAIDTSDGKAFIATSSGHIRGITRKGKQFFNLGLNDLNEPISHLRVLWPREIFVAGHYMCNHYTLRTEGNITLDNSYVSPGKINGMCIVHQVTSETEEQIIPIVASEDRTLRILSQSKCSFQFETAAIPMCLCSLTVDNEFVSSGYCGFLCGSSDGKVIMIDLTTQEPTVVWHVPEDLVSSGGKSNKSSVEVIEVSDGASEMFIGRADGTIEAWAFCPELTLNGPDRINYSSSPVIKFTYNCNESITSLVPAYDNSCLIASTFSGLIFGVSYRLNNGFAVANSNRKRVTEAQKRIESLRLECIDLDNKLTLERTRYIATHKEDTDDSIVPIFVVKDSFILTDDAEYLLTLEAEVALDTIIIQSDISVMLGDSEKNSAVVSITETETQQTLATFRCQTNTTRLEVTVKPIEGQFGYLRAYCVARLPPKTCHMKTFYLRPLSLHKRSHTPVDSDESLNVLRINGDFSLEQAYDWLHKCLPEVPSQIPPTNDTASIEYQFKSTLYSTHVSSSVRRGKLHFTSNSVSTISIIKDFITRDATSKSIPVQVDNTLSVSSVARVLKSLHPLALNLTQVTRLNNLREAVNELSRNDFEAAHSLAQEIEEELDARIILSPENKEETAPIGASSPASPSHPPTLDMNRINGLVTDLFIDYCKLRGLLLKDVKGKGSQLPAVLEKSLAEDDADAFVGAMFSHWGVEWTQ